MEQALGRAQTALKEARQAVEDLRVTPATTDDLIRTVRGEIDRFTHVTGLVCTADLAALAAIPVLLAEQVQRIVAESLTNIARHARARHVWVQARRRVGAVELEIRDDGVGFDPATVQTLAGHYGLLGIEERARLCGGQLALKSAHGVGTAIQLCVPVADIAE